jgi:hypothetical protein
MHVEAVVLMSRVEKSSVVKALINKGFPRMEDFRLLSGSSFYIGNPYFYILRKQIN